MGGGDGSILAAALIVLPLRFGPAAIADGAVGAVLVLGVGAALLRSGARIRRDGAAAALSLAFAVPAATVGVLPRLDRLWLSRAAAGLVAEHPPAAGMPLIAVGYNEPSLVFLLGTELHLDSAHGGAPVAGAAAAKPWSATARSRSFSRR